MRTSTQEWTKFGSDLQHQPTEKAMSNDQAMQADQDDDDNDEVMHVLKCTVYDLEVQQITIFKDKAADIELEQAARLLAAYKIAYGAADKAAAKAAAKAADAAAKEAYDWAYKEAYDDTHDKLWLKIVRQIYYRLKREGRLLHTAEVVRLPNNKPIEP